MKIVLGIIGIFIFLTGSISFIWSYFYYSPIQTPLPEFFDQETINNKKLPQTIIPAQKVNVSFYIDFDCEYCRKFYRETMAPFRKKMSTETNISVHLFPKNFEGDGFEISKFYKCAQEEKNKWDILDYLYFAVENFNNPDFEKWKKDLELDTEKLNACLSNEKLVPQILIEKESYRENSVKGTPTTFINTYKREGSLTMAEIEVLVISHSTKTAQ